uniref:ORF15 protein n=1 Tax=Plutella xylostella granulovirus TaxID=98383 RepID=A0A7U3U887_9BBAC|nr:ORF15 protein [Plutella xylostella granulovirus]QKV50058.1 ORF15 protein [Plutella xylostella granulovirus]
MDRRPLEDLKNAFFLRYGKTLDENFSNYELNITNCVIIKDLLVIIKNFQMDYGDCFYKFERIVYELMVKMCQYAIVIGDGTLKFDCLLKYYKRNCPNIVFKISCDNLSLCDALISENVTLLNDMINAIRAQKEKIKKMYESTLPDHCSVCNEKCKLITACQHVFCYDCYIKSKALKNTCPVCRSCKNFTVGTRDRVDMVAEIEKKFKMQYPTPYSP